MSLRLYKTRLTQGKSLTRTRSWLQAPRQRLLLAVSPAPCRKSRLHRPPPRRLRRQPMRNQANHQSQVKSSTSSCPKPSCPASLTSRLFVNQASRRSHRYQRLLRFPQTNPRLLRQSRPSRTIHRLPMRANPCPHLSKISNARVY